jgi:S-adenosylmethionine decarboxylase
MARKSNIHSIHAEVPKSFETADLVTPVKNDYFVEKDGVKFAGRHLLLDMWGAKHLGDEVLIERAMRQAAIASGATTLHVHLKKFGEEGGVSGVLVLAESHISIHTWPERGFAALDIFMCGACDPYKGVQVLKEAFEPESMQLTEARRGLVV